MLKTPQQKEDKKDKPESSMASLKDAKAVVEAGHPEGWGSVVEVAPKFNKFGLGFEPVLHHQILKAPNLATPVRFSNAGIGSRQTNAVDDSDNEFDIDRWIRPSVPSMELNNWTSEVCVPVTMVKE